MNEAEEENTDIDWFSQKVPAAALASTWKVPLTYDETRVWSMCIEGLRCSLSYQ